MSRERFTLSGKKNVLAALPAAKADHFSTPHGCRKLEPRKRYTLAAVLLQTQVSRVRDDLGQMFIERMMRIHRRAEEVLAFHYIKHQARTAGLIRTLRDVVTTYETKGGADKRLAAIGSVLSGKSAQVLEPGTMRSSQGPCR
jgi:hypothetical protein